MGGTILAAKLANERGWAINVGGGFHHCSADSGGGFCVYADITLSIRYAFVHLNISRYLNCSIAVSSILKTCFSISINYIVYVRVCEMLSRVMIIDLDAHQGNGHERDFSDDSESSHLSICNYNIGTIYISLT